MTEKYSLLFLLFAFVVFSADEIRDSNQSSLEKPLLSEPECTTPRRGQAPAKNHFVRPIMKNPQHLYQEMEQADIQRELYEMTVKSSIMSLEFISSCCCHFCEHHACPHCHVDETCFLCACTYSAACMYIIGQECCVPLFICCAKSAADCIRSEDEKVSKIEMSIMNLVKKFLKDDDQILEFKEKEGYALRNWIRDNLKKGEKWLINFSPIFLYTTDAFYAAVNEAINMDDKNVELFRKYKDMVSWIMGSLRTMDIKGYGFTRGTLFRGMIGVDESIMEQLRDAQQTKTLFHWPAFVSTSESKEKALNFTLRRDAKTNEPKEPKEQGENAVLFAIKVDQSFFRSYKRLKMGNIAARIENMSQYPEEKEVLFHPYSTFFVEHIDEEHVNSELEHRPKLPLITLRSNWRHRGFLAH